MEKNNFATLYTKEKNNFATLYIKKKKGIK